MISPQYTSLDIHVLTSSNDVFAEIMVVFQSVERGGIFSVAARKQVQLMQILCKIYLFSFHFVNLIHFALMSIWSFSKLLYISNCINMPWPEISWGKIIALNQNQSPEFHGLIMILKRTPHFLPIMEIHSKEDPNSTHLLKGHYKNEANE